MTLILSISLVCLFIAFLLLGYISPYDGDIHEISFDTIDEPIQVTNVVEEPTTTVIPTEEEVKPLWQNIGLELYNEINLDRFVEKLNFMVGKKILIVTDSSYVLGANFTDHKVYEGILTKYEVLEGRYPDQPSINFIVNVPVVATANVNLSWVYDKYRFDSDFSSEELVNNFLQTNVPVNELLLVEA
jgi:hypothetical protein